MAFFDFLNEKRLIHAFYYNKKLIFLSYICTLNLD